MTRPMTRDEIEERWRNIWPMLTAEDIAAIRADWHAVGDDLRVAIDKVGAELDKQQPSPDTTDAAHADVLVPQHP